MQADTDINWAIQNLSIDISKSITKYSRTLSSLKSKVIEHFHKFYLIITRSDFNTYYINVQIKISRQNKTSHLYIDGNLWCHLFILIITF